MARRIPHLLLVLLSFLGASAAAAGKVAVIVDGPDAAALEAAARDALAGADVLDPGAVRAARAFLGAGAASDEGLASLRSSLNVDRLLVIDVKSEGAKRFLGVRAIDAGGTSRRFGESTDADLEETVKRLVADLPAPAAAPAPPVPTPVAAAPVATPPPSWTPAPTPAPGRHSAGDEEQRYGKKGTKTLSIGAEMLSRETSIDAGIVEIDFSERFFELSPTIGYFLADSVFVAAGMQSEAYDSEDDFDNTEYQSAFALSLTAAYLADFESFFLGPQLTLQQRSFSSGENNPDEPLFEYGLSTMQILGGITARIPVGTRRGATFNVLLYFRQDTGSYTQDADGDVRATQIGIAQGLSVFF